MEQIHLLRKVPLLSELPEPELEHLAKTLRVVEVESGSTLFQEGEPGDSLYIVIRGRVEVVLAMDTEDEKVMAVLVPGEFVGEMGLLLSDGVRTAGVRAIEPARLWTMTRADFDSLLLRHPRLAFTVGRVLSQRLDATNMAAFHDLQRKNIQLQRAYDELKSAQAQIIEKERLERELRVAGEIQMSILPQELPRMPGYDFGALMVPARMVGGDFYDVFKIKGDRIGFLVGDVADKGVPSAIFMARAHALIMAEAGHSLSPARILQGANHHLIHLEQSSMFITVFLGILDCRTGLFDFARAGHEVPLFLSANGRVDALAHGVGQALGVLDKPRLDKGQVIVPPGCTLLLFTDGMTDGANTRGDLFGHGRLRKTLSRLADLGAQQTCDRLLKTLKNFQSDAPQFDDITLVAIHREHPVEG